MSRHKSRARKRLLATESLEVRNLLATLVWNAASDGAVWSSPSNWLLSAGTDSDGLPDADDVLVFNSTSGRSSVMDLPFEIGELRVASNYGGTISLGNNELSVSSGLLVSAASQLNAGSSVLSFSGPQIVNSAAPLANAQFATGGAITLARNLDIQNNLAIDDLGALNSSSTTLRSVNVLGDLSVSDGGYASSNTRIVLAGSSTQRVSGSGTLTDLLVSQSGAGEVQLLNDVRLGSNGSLAGSTASMIRGATSSEALVLTVPTNGTFSNSYQGTVEDVRIETPTSGNAAVVLTQSLIVSDSLVTTGQFSLNVVGTGRQIRVGGNVVNNANVSGAGPISLRGNQVQVLSGLGTLAVLDVSQGPNGEVQLANDFRLGNGGALRSLPDSVIRGVSGVEALVFGGSGGYTADYEGSIENLTIDLQSIGLTLNQTLSASNVNIVDLESISGIGTSRRLRATESFEIQDDGFVTLDAKIAMVSSSVTTLAATSTGNNGDLEVSKPLPTDIGMLLTDAAFNSIDVKVGSLDLAGNTATGPMAVQGAGRLVGSGRVAGPITVAALGVVSPGSPGVSVMSSTGAIGTIASGDLRLEPGALLALGVGGSVPGVSHDQIRVDGTVDLTDATLILSGTVATATTIVLIDNDNVDSVTGEFAGLPENSLVTLGTTQFSISYVGGDGNDVVLIPANAAPSLAVDDASVSASEGGVVVNSGIFSDPQGNATVTLSASVGTIVKNDTLGIWQWSLPVSDGPAGPITVIITASDGAVSPVIASFVYTVGNVSPSISLSGAATTLEGAEYTLFLGTLSDPGDDSITSYTIDWGDGTVQSFTGSPENSVATHVYADGPDSVTNQIRVLDEDGEFLAGTFPVQIINVAPMIMGLATDFSTPCDASIDGLVTLTGAFDDPGQDTHQLLVDWGDGSAPQLIDVTEPGFNVSRQFGQGGVYSISVTVIDSDGQASETITVSAAVRGIGLVKGTLYIIGSSSRDIVTLNREDRGRNLVVHLASQNGANSWTYDREVYRNASIARVVSYLCGGDDSYDGSGSLWHPITQPQFVFAGSGDDCVVTGKGNDVIIGGSGDDHLWSLQGNDILIGGDGRDALFGGLGDDLLYGASAANQDDLLAMMAASSHWANGREHSALLQLGTLTDDEDCDWLWGGWGHDRIIRNHHDVGF